MSESEVSLSLKQRMRQRSEQIERDTAEVFAVPGYEDIFGVRLRALSYEAVRKIQRRNENRRLPETTRETYNMADQILAATEGFVAISDGEGEDLYTDLPDESWVSLASALPDTSTDLTPRQALLKLTGKRLMFLMNEWVEWQRTVRTDIDEEVQRDFVQTG